MYCAHFCIAVTIENKQTAAKKNGGGDFTGSYQWQVDRQVASKWYTIGLVHSVLGSLKLSRLQHAGIMQWSLSIQR